MDEERLRHEERAIREYVLMESPQGETIKHAEKVASHHVHGTRHDIWDVHTSKDKWWVITEPTNLYRQRDFRYMDMAFTFHLGLAVRLSMRDEPVDDDVERVHLAGAWRRLAQASEALNAAEEAEDFQAVGMRCREALVSFCQDLEHPDVIPDDQVVPKDSDFVGWTEVIADRVAPGDGGRRIRTHLKSLAKSTWDLVGWLVHAKNATRSDAVIAFEATHHTLGVYSMTILRAERGEPGRCPNCSSYRLTHDYRPELGAERSNVTRCEACGWEDLPDDLDMSAVPDRDLSRPTRREDFMDLVSRDMIDGE